MQDLQAAFDLARRKVWARQPDEFFACARIDADGTLVETAAECKQGVDLSYKGIWGYHPLVLTLANTGEVLRLVNRSGIGHDRFTRRGASFETAVDPVGCRWVLLDEPVIEAHVVGQEEHGTGC